MLNYLLFSIWSGGMVVIGFGLCAKILKKSSEEKFKEYQDKCRIKYEKEVERIAALWNSHIKAVKADEIKYTKAAMENASMREYIKELECEIEELREAR